MGDFLLNRLPDILEKEKTVSTLILNNLNNFFSTTSYKYTHDPKTYCIQLLFLAKKFGINVIYLNDIFYYCETKFLLNLNNINYNPELQRDKNNEEPNQEDKNNDNEIVNQDNNMNNINLN